MKKFLTLISILICSSTIAQEKIDLILEEIQKNNQELKALESDIKASLLEMKAENTISGPSVEYSPFYTKGYHGMASSELVVSQEFDFPTLYRDRSRQTKAEGKALESLYETRKREILLEARLLYYDIIRLNQLVDLSEERMNQLDQMLSLVQKRQNAGDANALEINKTRLERMQVSQYLVEILNEQQNTLLELQQLNGGQPVTCEERTFPVLPAPSEPYPTELPEVKSAQAQLEASRQKEQLAEKNWLPKLSIGYRRNTEEKTKLNGFLVGAAFPLFSKSLQSRSAQQRVQSEERRLEALKIEIETQQKSRHNELLRIQGILDHSDTQLLRETLELLKTAMQHGQITALQYYDECSEIYNQLSNHINLHCKYVQRYTELYNR